ncbi:MAG: hypothetical protein Q8S18_02130 [Bacteroidales bacterium]|nr:hypothetical protein [Bacteroidales bacterium]
MRNYRLFLSLAAATMLFGGIMIIHSCSKQDTGVKVADENLLAESQAMTEKVLAFKQRMEYYRDNPGLKSGGLRYTADSAAQAMEELINFTYCHTDIVCNKKVVMISDLLMPLDDIYKISDPDLMEVYYNKVKDTIRAQMLRTDFDNMKLLLVMLELDGIDANRNAIIKVRSVVGNHLISPVLTSENGYWYGELYGDCQNFNAGVDATTILVDDLNFLFFPSPAPGYRLKKVPMILLPPLSAEDYWIVPEESRDNFQDSKIFIAKSIYGTITDDTKCLSSDNLLYLEMEFYHDQYRDLILELEENYDMDLCDVNIFDKNRLINNSLQIEHEIELFLGKVLIIVSEWDVTDILNEQ